MSVKRAPLWIFALGLCVSTLGFTTAYAFNELSDWDWQAMAEKAKERGRLVAPAAPLPIPGPPAPPAPLFPPSPADPAGDNPNADPGRDPGLVLPEAPQPPQPSPGQSALTPEERQQEHSWWFKRNSKHLAPTTDPRFVAQLWGKGFYLGDTSRKVVYLTFDAGYENGYTAPILDTLKASGVKAIFFLCGTYVDKNSDLVKRIAQEGHIIGNHTQSHPNLAKLAPAEIAQELKTVDAKVLALTGQSCRYMRPPSGVFSFAALEEIRRLGYVAVFWSLAYRDWLVDDQPGAEAAYRQVMDNLHPGAVILLHNVSSSNAQALDRIIKAVKAKGYTFGSLDEISF